jgi:hypothetical protein
MTVSFCTGRFWPLKKEQPMSARQTIRSIENSQDISTPIHGAPCKYCECDVLAAFEIT